MRLWISVILLTSSAVAHSETTTIDSGYIDSGYFEITLANDIIFHSDDNYTGGGYIGWSPKGSRFEFHTAVDIYTPTNKKTETQPKGEHPYAAYGYIGFIYNIPVMTDRFSMSIGADFGSVGPRIKGGGIQNWIHLQGNKPLFNGWDNQIFNLWVYNLKNKTQFTVISLNNMKLGLYSPLECGNYRCSFGLGVEARLGFNVKKFGHHRQSNSSYYVFARIEKQHVTKDIALQGNFKKKNGQAINSYSVELVNDIVVTNVGARLDFNIFFFELELIEVSKQFTTQVPSKDRHSTLSLGFRY